MAEYVLKKRSPGDKEKVVSPVSVQGVPNPFCHSLRLSNWNKIKIAVMTVTILPLRIIGVMLCLVTAWALAGIGLLGVSEKDQRERPLTGWRRTLRAVVSQIMVGLFYCAGFNKVRVRGKQATPREAPILALASHSTFYDALAVVFLGSPSIVAKDDVESVPFFWNSLASGITLCGRLGFRIVGYRVSIKGRMVPRAEAPLLVIGPHSTFADAMVIYWITLPHLISRAESRDTLCFGKLINFTQPIYVGRDDTNSRVNTIKEMVRRATSEDDWQQILIFPEGTCTNREALITFKPGAFIPGVPVQPVCLRYPNKLDTLTWAWEGPGTLQILWYTMTQFVTYAEIEFLPPYVPNEEEKRNPKLFADNVRREMAKCLEVPVAEYSYEDCRLVSKAMKLGLPSEVGLIEAAVIKSKYGLDQKEVETKMLPRFAEIANREEGVIRLEDFASYLQIPVNHPCLHQVFRIYDGDCSGALTFRKFIIGQVSVSLPAMTEENMKTTFELLDRGAKGFINVADVAYAMEKSFVGFTESLKFPIFGLIEDSEITYDDFVGKVQERPEYAKFFEIFRQSYAPAS